MNDEKIKNPFANPDGSPMNDKLKEFIEWEEAHREEMLKKLPPDEADQIKASMEALNKRMDS